MEVLDRFRRMTADSNYVARHRMETNQRRSRQARSWARQRQRGHDSEQNYWLDYLDRENAELRKHLAALTHLLIAQGTVTREQVSEAMAILNDVSGEESDQYLGPIVPPPGASDLDEDAA